MNDRMLLVIFLKTRDFFSSAAPRMFLNDEQKPAQGLELDGSCEDALS